MTATAALELPRRDDRIVLVVPRTLWINHPIFLYAHGVYSESLHSLRLLRWLESTCREVMFIDNLRDPGSGVHGELRLVAGPRSGAAYDVQGGWFGLGDEGLASRLTQFGRPDAVWITTLFPYDRTGIQREIAIIKQHYPSVPVVLGGAYASLCPEDARALGADDVHSGLLEPVEQMATCQRGSVGFVCVSRGCPNRCAYCANHLVEDRSWMLGVDALLEQIDDLLDAGVGLLDLYSLNFFTHDRASAAEQLLAELALRETRVLLWTGLEPRRLTPKRARLIREAGAIDVLVPLQTHDRTLARRWGRTESLADYQGALAMLLDAGFDRAELASDILIGHGEQTLEEAVKSACFVWSQGLSPLMFPYTFVPGSADAEAARGQLEGLLWESWFPYLWPFASERQHPYHLSQLSILSRVEPRHLGAALAYLDPDTPVPGLIERYLDEFGFSVTATPLDAPLPGLTTGYHTFFSHPWETAFFLATRGHLEAAVAELPACAKVRSGASKYMEIARRVLVGGNSAAAAAFAKEAAAGLPRQVRLAVHEGLAAHPDQPAEAFTRFGAAVAAVLESDGHDAFARRWRAVCAG